jgi:glycosyltransferase involved in cell wall biosynthesis
MVALEDRFHRTRNGNIYSNTVCDYTFWSAYLQLFDEVIVFARLDEIPEKELDRPRANGPNVSFYGLPYYVGPWQYLKQQHKIKALAKRATTEADAFILRIPGIISTLLWHHLMRKRIPYGVEVVGDPWDSLSPGSVKSIVRPLIRLKMRWDQLRQCRHAIAASYVTEYSLQKRYPPGHWSIYYSDVALSPHLIIDDKLVEERIKTISRKHDSNGPWRVCYAGTMAQLYKAPDVLIDAVAQCIAGGLNLELVMLGDGQYRNQLQEQAKRLGIGEKVMFRGMLPAGQAVYEQFDQADLYVLPSRQEGLPRALIEAMARGLPCIGSNVGGIPELLAAEDMVAPRDATALAAKIESVLKNPNRVMQMSRLNLQTARKYCSDTRNKRRMEFYKKVVDETRAYYSSDREYDR